MNKKIFIVFLGIVLLVILFLAFSQKNEPVAAKNVFDRQDLKSIPSFPTIVYHEVTTDPSETKSTVVSVDEFKKHLQLIQSAGYTTINDLDIYNYVYLGKQLPEKPIHITFDDGYESNYSLAFPLLKEFNMKTTIFPITTAIDDPTYVSDRKILTWDHIKEMSDSGLVSIQNHSDRLHHKTSSPGYDQSIMVSDDFSSFDNSTKIYIYEDLSLASKKISEKTNKRVFSMSYPFGSYDERSIDSAKASGILYAYTLSGTLTDFSKQSNFELGRINIPSGLSDDEFLSLIRIN